MGVARRHGKSTEEITCREQYEFVTDVTEPVIAMVVFAALATAPVKSLQEIANTDFLRSTCGRFTPTRTSNATLFAPALKAR